LVELLVSKRRNGPVVKVDLVFLHYLTKGRRNNNLDESTEGILSKPEVRECSSSPDECCAVVGQARPFVSLTL